ncbi:MAG: hypothetical protein WKF47_05245 [Geodermatophilaceae bacterium]
MGRSWVPVPHGSDFPVTNLPYGVFRGRNGRRIGVAIGEHILDLAGAVERGLLDEPTQALRTATLNDFMASGRPQWTRVRERVTELLTDESCRGNVEPLLVRQDAVTMCLPFEVADYVDFYSSKNHAANVGQIFRPDAPELLPNWSHLPVGYHGRRRHRSGLRHGHRAPLRPAQGPDGGRTDVRAHPSGWTSRPRWASSSACRPRSANRVSTVDFVDHVFGVVPGQRLVSARHTGLGVRAAGPVPRQVLRHLDLTVGGAVGRR